MQRVETRETLGERDLEVLRHVLLAAASYDPGADAAFDRLIVEGRYPDTIVSVFFDPPTGQRSRRYHVHKQFVDDDPELIASSIWADLIEYF